MKKLLLILLLASSLYAQRISELPELEATPADEDLTVVVDATDGATKKLSILNLKGIVSASGDSITVNGTTVDTTGNIDDTSTIEWVHVDGGAGGPDDIRANIVANSVGPTQFNGTANYTFTGDLTGNTGNWDFSGLTSLILPGGTQFGSGNTPFNLTSFTDDVCPTAPGTVNQFAACVDRATGLLAWILNGGSLKYAVTTTDTQTLTNKTLTAPVISSIVNAGTLTLPTATDTLVGRTTTDTLTNKTLTSPVLTSVSGGSVGTNGTLLYDSNVHRYEGGLNGVSHTFVMETTAQTLTNKTLTEPTINNPVLSTNTYLTLTEMAAPGNPAADDARLYAKDVGGITKICMKNSSGTETCIGDGGGGNCVIDLGGPVVSQNQAGTSSPADGWLWGTGTVASGSGNFKHINIGDTETITFVGYLPNCWTSETLRFDIDAVFGTSTGTATMDIQTACVGDNEDIVYNTAQTLGGLTKGSYTSNFLAKFSLSSVTMTGCAANEQINIRGTLAIGTLSSDFRFIAGRLRNQ